MKILLVNPIYNRLSEEKEPRKNLYSLGLAVLQTEFQKCNVVCDILDLNYHKDAATRCGSYENIVSTFIQLDEYKYIGITSFSNNFVNAILLAETIKNKMPSTTVFLGGAHASACAYEIIKTFPFINFINIGEGEKSVKNIVEYFQGKISIESIPNIAYFDGLKVRFTQAMDLLSKEELPILLPKMSLLGVNHSRLFNESADIEGGRGCPFNCVFCSTKNFWQRKCRMKPLDTILYEMDQLHQKCGIQHFSITHDLFTANKEFISQFCDSMKERKFSWTCSARFDTISCSILDKMYESGCLDVFYGIETGSQELQTVINKNLDLKKVEDIIQYCNEHHYMHTISFILGFPFETPAQLNETLMFIIKYYGCSYTKVRTGILTPEVGTKVYSDYHDKMHFDRAYMLRNYDYVQLEKDRELSLIKSYPNIFSHFYFLENPNFSIHALRFIEKAVRFLCVNYYKTLGLAIEKSGNVLKVISNIIKVPFSTMSDTDYEDAIQNFDKKFKEFINQNPDLFGIFEYESLIKKLKSCALSCGSISKSIVLDKPYPTLGIRDITTNSSGEYHYCIHVKSDHSNLHKITLRISQEEDTCADVE